MARRVPNSASGGFVAVMISISWLKATTGRWGACAAAWARRGAGAAPFFAAVGAGRSGVMAFTMGF